MSRHVGWSFEDESAAVPQLTCAAVGGYQHYQYYNHLLPRHGESWMGMWWRVTVAK